MTKPSVSKAAASLSVDPRGQPVHEMLSRASEACLGACEAWHAETARFLLKRFERDAELARRLLGCRDWSDALILQQEWASAAVLDYLEQTRRVADVAGRLRTIEIAAHRPAVSERPTDAAA